MITLIAIDPGTSESAIVAMSGREILAFAKEPNDSVLGRLDFHRLNSDANTMLAVEMVGSYGMAVGAEVFETCLWIGRFLERWRGRHRLVKRHEVKSHLCGSQRAKDSNIRAALLEKYGGKAKAIGGRESRGPLHGITGDCWSALAVAITYIERGDVEVGSGVIGRLT